MNVMLYLAPHLFLYLEEVTVVLYRDWLTVVHPGVVRHQVTPVQSQGTSLRFPLSFSWYMCSECQSVIQRYIPENIQCLLVLPVDSGKAFRLFSVVQFLCPLVRLPATVEIVLQVVDFRMDSRVVTGVGYPVSESSTTSCRKPAFISASLLPMIPTAIGCRIAAFPSKSFCPLCASSAICNVSSIVILPVYINRNKYCISDDCRKRTQKTCRTHLLCCSPV